MQKTGWIIGLMALFLTTSCHTYEARDNAQRLHDDAYHEYTLSYHKIKDYFNPKRPPEPVTPVMPPSYCYRTQADVLCYRQPLPGQDERIVGAQAPILADGYDNGPSPSYTVSTPASPPPAPLYQPMSATYSPPAPFASATPAPGVPSLNRPAPVEMNSEPVFVGAAPEVKGTTSSKVDF